MRDILFRAKIINSDKWVEGGYCESAETTYCCKEDYERNPVPIHHYIVVDRMTDWGMPNELTLHRVKADTVCQYTGQKDKNGKKIFEGDILEAHLDDRYPDDITRVTVEFVNGGWKTRQGDLLPDTFEDEDGKTWTVVGNMFDNPELVESGVVDEKNQ